MPRLFITLAVVLTLGQAMAQDVFTVPEVPVFAEAKTAAIAKEDARDQGRRVALDLLLRRLVAEEDWIYLPRLSEGEPAPAFEDVYRDPFSPVQAVTKRAISLDPEQVRSFEQETNIFNEKLSGTTYRANITYRFKPEPIRNILRGARIPYSEEQARKAMVLPVLVTGEGVYLWESKNPWARAWLERPLTNELTPMVLPVGDVIDVQAITAEEARELNAAALRAFLERYDVGQLYLAVGSLSEQAGEFRLYVRLIEATPPAIDVVGTTASAIGTTVTEAFFRGPDDDFPALARRAVEATVQRHAREWKRQTLVDYSLERTFELTGWYEGQREFSQIQDAIDSTALVTTWEDVAFNQENTIWLITAVGEEAQFDLAMQQRGLDVWQDAGGRWHIALEARARELQQSMQPLTTDIDREAERKRRGLGRFFGRRDRADEPPGGGSSTENGGSGPEPEGSIPALPEDLFGEGDAGGQ